MYQMFSQMGRPRCDRCHLGVEWRRGLVKRQVTADLASKNPRQLHEGAALHPTCHTKLIVRALSFFQTNSVVLHAQNDPFDVLAVPHPTHRKTTEPNVFPAPAKRSRYDGVPPASADGLEYLARSIAVGATHAAGAAYNVDSNVAATALEDADSHSAAASCPPIVPLRVAERRSVHIAPGRLLLPIPKTRVSSSRASDSSLSRRNAVIDDAIRVVSGQKSDVPEKDFDAQLKSFVQSHADVAAAHARFMPQEITPLQQVMIMQELV
jgi:hypothetical protein